VDVATTGTDVTVTYLGDNQLRLTAGATAGSINYSATPPGASAPALGSASVVTLQPGVVSIPDDSVAFPPLYVDLDEDPLAALGDAAGPDGVSGFTWAELQARTYVATSASADDPDDFLAPNARFPLILRGPPPATGQLLVTGGGSGVTGRVVEPDGTPTLQRNGLSLVTVAMVALDELYVDLDYSFNSDDLVTLGAGDLLAAPAAPTPDPSGSAGPQGLRSPAAAMLEAEPAADPPGETPKGPCSVGTGTASLLLDPFVPNSQRSLDLVADTANNYYKFVVTVSESFDFGFGVEMRATATASCTVTLFGPVGNELPAPLGPLSGILSSVVQAEVIATAQLELAAGPRATFALRCSLGLSFNLGLEVLDGRFNNLSKWNDPIANCNRSKAELNIGATDDSVAVQLTATAGPAVKIELAGRIGGSVARALGTLFNDPELGKSTFLEVVVGPQAVGVFETEANMLVNQTAGSRIGAEVKGSVTVNAAGVKWLLKAFGNSAGEVGVTLWSNTSPPLDAFTAANSTALTYSIDGAGGAFKPVNANEPIFVQPGDELVVRSQLSSAAGAPKLEKVLTFGGLGWNDTVDFRLDPNPSADMFQVSRTITEQSCQTTNDFNGGFNVEDWRIAGTSTMSVPLIGDLVPAPVWGGAFQTRCTRGTMRFEPTEMIITDTGSARLVSTGAGTVTWDARPSLPSWLRMSPTHGEWADSPDDEQGVLIALERIAPPTAECAEPRTGVVVARSDRDRRGSARLTVSEPDLCYIRFEPPTLTGSGDMSSTIVTAGIEEDRYTVVPSSVPDWIQLGTFSAERELGTLAEQRINFELRAEERTPDCTIQLPRTATIIVKTLTRGEARLTVTQPKVPRRLDCEPRTGGATGDPHIGTFDGLYYDAQIRGEYVYARTTPEAVAAGNDVEIRGRTDSTRANVLTDNVTSITAASVRVGDHTVEVYSRSAAGATFVLPRIFVDGTLTDTIDAQPISVAPGFTLVRNGPNVAIEAPGAQIAVRTYSGIMDLLVTALPGSPFVGILGTPNGDPADDLRTATGQTLTYFDVAATDTGLWTLTDSWRITDPADTSFTVGYPGFADGNLPRNSAGLEAERAEAAQLLARLSSVCDVENAARTYLLEGLVLELRIGRTIEDLTNYTCKYAVSGVATSGTDTVPGLAVTVDVPGLQRCTTTTNALGSYQCILRPDLAEATTDPPPDPFALPATVTARFGDGSIAATATTTIDTIALAGGRASGAFADLDIDPALLPNVRLSGTMTDAGRPITVPVALDLQARDTTGRVLASVRAVVTPAAEGTYAVTRVLPYGSTSVEVAARYGRFEQDHVRVSAGGLRTGINEVPLNVAYDPTVVTVAGTMTGVGGVALGPQQVAVIAEGPSGPISTDVVTVTPGPDGSYATPPVVVPLATTRIVAEARVGVISADWVRTALSNPQPGARTIPLDVDYRPPTLAIAGTMTADGAPIVTPVTLRVRSFDAAGDQLSDVPREVTPGAEGVYSLDVAVPTGAVRAVVIAQVGVIPADYPTAEVADLRPGPNPVALDVGFAPPSVTVTGTLVDATSAPLGPTFVVVRSFDGATQLDSVDVNVIPGAGGTYTTGRLLLPLAADRVVATAQIGVVSGDHVSATLDPLGAGSNALRLDAVYDPPTLAVSGTLTDGAGGPLPAGQRIEVTSFEGAALLRTDTVSVSPAAGTGAYTTTLTLPTRTTRVVVAAAIGAYFDDRVSQEAAIDAGALNEVTLNALYDPPIVSISGRLGTEAAPITNNVQFDVRALDADGQLIVPFTLTARPNSIGIYPALELPLPNRATSVAVTARIGLTNADWVTRTFDVARGQNPITFDASVNATVLNVSGLLSRDGAAVTEPVTVYVRSYDAANNLLTVATRFVTSDPDGRYDLGSIVAPTGTTTVRIQADVSPFSDDDIVAEYTGIAAGANDLTFDIVDTTTWLDLTGQLQRGADPFTDQFDLQVIHTVPPGKSADVRNYTVFPEGDGTYRLFVQLPDAATGAALIYSLPSGTNPEFVTDFQTTLDGFVAGEVNERAHSITWTPRQFVLSGLIERDPPAPGELVRLSVDWLDADGEFVDFGYSETLWNLDDDNGEYGTTLTPPDGATQAVVTVEIGPVYDWFTQVFDLEPDGVTEASFDVSYRPIGYRVHGRIRQLGVPIDRVRATVIAFDADGEIARLVGDEVTIDDPEGDFDVSLGPVPRGAVRIDACLEYRLSGGEVEGQCTGFDIDPELDIDIDHVVVIDTQGLRLTGSLIDAGGDPITADDRVSVEAEEFDADGNPIGGFGVLVQAKDFAADGSLDMLLRSNVDTRSVRLRFGGGVVLDIALPDPAVTTEFNLGTYTYLPPP
jgi:hypothetical protein